MQEPGSGPPLARWLAEPTFHFALLAGALFAASALLASDDADVVTIDRAEVARRVEEIESANGIPLTDEERARVEDALVAEEILVREALAAGLDDDPRIRDFLVQKMLHVLSADVIQPTGSELLAHYQANLDRYTSPPAVTLDEVVIPADAAAEAVRRLSAGTPPEVLASDARIRHDVLRRASPDALARVFGPGTAERILAASPGDWVGPHVTVRGEHWFRVTERSAAVTAPLEVVREQVRLDWIAEQEETRLDERVHELRGRYRVVFRDGRPSR